ncbi:alpha-ketoglutarate-dependent dioxygenase AlkB [Candidatus Poribacteria bacterium]|nr:alpha-ketoglutarate-dependent dioxygenase AlkB [Candidatus Poribacteria bacterium]MYG09209.1 alpha-ketoglutarate-dependent dioxygenase AlkB [Candidatus Poribacteria bacterium]MYK20986.1 alpha-ketoglutarate-dependent dioxygenase AlkB [Candidatus Poribacteria bacterium]
MAEGPIQLTLLDPEVGEKQSPQLQPIEKKEVLIETVSGLRYIENYITANEHEALLAHVDNGLWLDDLKRRVQHYGFKYNYRARRVDMSMRVGELPEWLKSLSEKLHQDGYMPEVADQVIVNEYLPGQGISAHIDCEPCFKDTIVSLSLGSSCVMDFTNKLDRNQKIPVQLAPRSLVVLKDAARYRWLHSIAARRWDQLEGNRYYRERRVSLTFRKVIINSV